MKSMSLTITVLLTSLFSMQAQAINLDCNVLTTDVLQQLADTGLLSGGEVGKEQAHTIIMTSCRGAEASAEKQHADSKKEWVKNWLFENTGGKPGNKRLRNLKR